MRKLILGVILPSIMFGEGLKLQKEIASGHSGDHIVLSEGLIDYENQTMLIGVKMYKSKAAKDAGKSEMHYQRHEIPLPAGCNATMMRIELKKLDYFIGATDAP